MRNKYAGPCYRCGLTVEPDTGHFERHKGGWRVRHHDHIRSPRAVTCAVAASRAEKQKAKAMKALLPS